MKRNMRWIRNRWEGIFIFIFFVISFFLVVFENNNITNIRYEITYLEDTLKEEKTRESSLKIEIAKLTLPERIETQARSYGFVNIPLSSIAFIEDVKGGSRVSEKGESYSFVAKLLNVFARQKEDFKE